MRREYFVFAALIVIEIVLLSIGCHGKGFSPTLPSLNFDQQEETAESTRISPPSERTLETAQTPVLWGLYRVSYDSASHSIECVPLRASQFAWNVVKFLQPPAGSGNNMVVSVLDDSQFHSNGLLDVRVILHHPFPGQPTYTGFDVCGVFLTEGTNAAPGNSHITYANPAVDPTVLNPDGYTRWMNPTEFLTGDVFGYEPGIWGTSESSENSGFLAGATVNPFKYFAQGLGPSAPLKSWVGSEVHDSGRGMFPSGATCSRDYELRFPKKNGKLVFVFNYAVIANWAPPDVEPPLDPLNDFPDDANARYPIHVFVTDRSEVYHTPLQSGGVLRFDVEIFDWDAVLKHVPVPSQVSKISVWSNSPLVPGGQAQFLSEDVEWNSGFTASTSVATVEIEGAVPSYQGKIDVWLAVESSDPSSYDQGFGAKVPSDPIASYVTVPVYVADCPKAYMTNFATKVAGTGSFLDNVEITGYGFHPGEDLSVYLELMEADGKGGNESPVRIYASDVKYVNSSSITADFDLTGAVKGSYGYGCVNGCGLETLPSENAEQTGADAFEVVLASPSGIKLSSNREGPQPLNLSYVTLTWQQVEGATHYKVFLESWDSSGTSVYNGPLTSTTYTSYSAPLTTLKIQKGGTAKLWVTSLDVTSATGYESLPSSYAMLFYQGFEESMGGWVAVEEDGSSAKFVRSSTYANYTGMWGVRAAGAFPWYPGLWAVLASPAIPEVKGAGTVKFEFLHRHIGIYPTNGYQVGWCNKLPADHPSEFPGYFPVTSAASGFDYNDFESTALQSEFGVTSSTDQNYQTNSSNWIGWYLSSFNVSAILGDGKPNYVLIALAGNYFDLMDLTVDEVAILVY